MTVLRACLAGTTALTLLASCAGQERPSILTPSGVSPLLARQSGGTASLIDRFLNKAAAAQPGLDGQEKGSQAQREYMTSGFALVYVTCNQYLERKSDRQRQVNVWRDTFAPLTALLTGVVALADGGKTVDSDFLAAISLASTSASSGFKVYEERYLFSAENVNSVRRLILEALISNAGKSQEIGDDRLSFEQASISIIDNQVVCSPGNILELVSDAISAGKITSSKSSDEPEPEPDATPTLAPAHGPSPAPSPSPSASPTVPPPGLERVTTKVI